MNINRYGTLLAMIFSSASMGATLSGYQHCSDNKNLSHIIPCVINQAADHSPDYTLIDQQKLDRVTVKKYRLDPLLWPTSGLATPENWQHQVDIYIPDKPRRGKAVLFINNGTNNNINNKPPYPSTDLTPTQLTSLAEATQTIFVSVSDVPNQYQLWLDDNKFRAEDDSVAHSWRLFMQQPDQHQLLPLNVPMAASVTQALSLAEKELAEWRVNRFIVSGVSKRGWATWLTAIGDERVEAIVPFAMDMLETRAALKHMYQTYGNNWPVAFLPYYQQETDRAIDTRPFKSLMNMLDPIAYKKTRYAERLEIPKYIISASGDDFYVPDNSRYYYEKLPGVKSLRVLPNSDHAGVRQYVEQSLTSLVNRIQTGKHLAQLKEEITPEGKLRVKVKGTPAKITLWRATNPYARDFRRACGIEYKPTVLPVRRVTELALKEPEQGWQASFVEATYDDGYTVTSQVYITPDDIYPQHAPVNKGGACQTLPGRGFVPPHEPGQGFELPH